MRRDNDQLSIYMGQSAETSDFIVDCLTAWWQENQFSNFQLDRWVINLDGGAATRSNRTQVIKRMVELCQVIGVKIRLIYYPPYHSKYNQIERCWAVLENYWNGTILNSVETAIQWASNMTWKGIKPIVHLVETTYDRGVTVSSDELKYYQSFWQCSPILPKWDITITPT